jgi:hypothetical protein
MGVFDRIEQLKRRYTDQYVVVDETRPELARFIGRTGRVKTVNMNGRALVEFDAFNDIGWYDIDPGFLRVVEGPPKAPVTQEKGRSATAAQPAAAEKPAAAEEPKEVERGAKKAGAGGSAPATAEGGRPTTAEILAAARRKKGSAAAPAAAGADAPPVAKAAAAAEKPAALRPAAGKGAKLSTAEIIALARGGKPSGTAAGDVVEKEPAEAPQSKQKKATKQPAALPAADVAPPATSPKEPRAPENKPAKISRPADMPTDTAGKIAWCRAHDGKRA